MAVLEQFGMVKVDYEHDKDSKELAETMPYPAIQGVYCWIKINRSWMERPER
jgi:hypothetical protein